MGRSKVPPTKRGYAAYEVVSAYQKAIRRSDVDGAIYWGAELYKSGFGNWAWKRLRVIVSEDIGPAAPGLPADVGQLESQCRDRAGKLTGGLMYFVHATILAARAPKCRIADWALFSVASTDYDDIREVPDEALDKHTGRGKAQGRGWEHFVEEGAKLEQPERGGGEVDPELQRLEEKYRAVFIERKIEPEDDPYADLEADESPKPKQRKQGRLLP